MKHPVLAALLLSGVAAPALADVPVVVTDMPVIQSLVAQVMGDLGSPSVLLGQGGNAHSWQMKPSQAAALQAADLVFWVGPEMTPWLGRALEATAPKGRAVELLETPGTHLQDFGGAAHLGGHDHEHEAEAEHDHDHAAEAGHDHEAEHDEGEHDEGEAGHVHEGLDPHAWLTPENAAVWLGAIATDLAAADPAHAATYAANATAAQAEVAALDAALKAELAPLATRPFVVFHQAYGYFASHYGLTVAGSVAFGDAAEPGAAHLTELRDTLAAQGVICAFPEANHDTKQIDMLLDGTAVKRGAALDPEGAALPPGPGLYGAMMRGMAATLSACLTP